MLEFEIKTTGICGELSQSRRCQDFAFAEAGSSASLSFQITLSTAMKWKRREVSPTAASSSYTAAEKAICLVYRRARDLCMHVSDWLLANKSIWLLGRSIFVQHAFSGIILLFIRANWQRRKWRWCVMCYWGNGRELVVIPSLIKTSFRTDRKDLDKSFFPAEDSVPLSSWVKPQVLLQSSLGGCFPPHPTGS